MIHPGYVATEEIIENFGLNKFFSTKTKMSFYYIIIYMNIFEKMKRNSISPVVEMICRNLNNFGLSVYDCGTRVDIGQGEVYNYICTGNSTIKMTPNSSRTSFVSMIDTSLMCKNQYELELRIEEFIKVYIAVLFIHTVLTEEDIEFIKKGIPYCKNGIKSVFDRKEDSFYVTIFDYNNRRSDNLLQNHN